MAGFPPRRSRATSTSPARCSPPPSLWEREGPPEPILRGDELAAAVGIEPGPELGAAVRELEAAQYSGDVADRDSAIAHLRSWRADQ